MFRKKQYIYIYNDNVQKRGKKILMDENEEEKPVKQDMKKREKKKTEQKNQK